MGSRDRLGRRAHLYVRTDSWYTGANVPGKPRQFLAHLRGSQYFDHLTHVAENGFEGFVFEASRTDHIDQVGRECRE